MEYIKAISPLSILLAIVASYVIPYIGLTVFTLTVGEGFQSLGNGLVIIGWLFIVAPLITGYIGAKYSKKLPILNGMLATCIGIAIYFTHGSFNIIWLTYGFICLSLLLGYLGAKRSVAHD